jgi:hypothetical protein
MEYVPGIQKLRLFSIKDTKHLYILNINIIYVDLYHIYSVIQYKYVGVTGCGSPGSTGSSAAVFGLVTVEGGHI